MEKGRNACVLHAMMVGVGGHVIMTSCKKYCAHSVWCTKKPNNIQEKLLFLKVSNN